MLIENVKITIPMKHFIVIYMVILISSCSSQNGRNNADTTQSSKEKNAYTEINSCYKIVNDSVEIPPFEIQIKLNNNAEKTIETTKETIIISAIFSGILKNKTTENNDYQIELLSLKKELSNDRIVKFEGINISKKIFQTLDNGDLIALINVYSGRKSTNVNLLDCEMLQDTMCKMYGKRYVINGKLISEYSNASSINNSGCLNYLEQIADLDSWDENVILNTLNQICQGWQYKYNDGAEITWSNTDKYIMFFHADKVIWEYVFKDIGQWEQINQDIEKDAFTLKSKSII